MLGYYLNLPKLQNIHSLSREINISVYTLNKISFNIERNYKEITVDKKSGGERTISIPSKKLKLIQLWILRSILEKVPFENSATAFRKKTNIKKNLEKHSGKDFFLCLDIENFFGSIEAKNVNNFFQTLGYNKNVSFILTKFCTYKGALPQGGVTSPLLSNILNVQLDKRLNGFLSPKGIIYTRYADDIILSSNHPDKLMKVKKRAEDIISDQGYSINSKKTRLLRIGSQRKIVGLVYSDNQNIGIGRKKKRELRAKIYDYETNPLTKIPLNHLLGWMSFIKDVDPNGYEQLNKYWINLKEKLKVDSESESDRDDVLIDCDDYDFY